MIENCKCGSADIVASHGTDNNFYIYCYKCQRQVRGKTINEAENKWNKLDIAKFERNKRVGKKPEYIKGLVNG